MARLVCDHAWKAAPIGGAPATGGSLAADELVQRFDAIDLLQGALQLGVHILPLVQDLRRVAGFDQFLSRAQRRINQGRVEHERRQRDREE